MLQSFFNFRNIKNLSSFVWEAKKKDSPKGKKKKKKKKGKEDKQSNYGIPPVPTQEQNYLVTSGKEAAQLSKPTDTPARSRPQTRSTALADEVETP